MKNNGTIQLTNIYMTRFPTQEMADNREGHTSCSILPLIATVPGILFTSHTISLGSDESQY